MKTLKETAKEVRNDIGYSLTELRQGNIKSPQRADKIMITLIVLISVMLFGTLFAFAADNIFDKVGEWIDEYYLKIAGMATGLAALSCIIGFIIVMLGGEDGARSGKRWIKRTLVAYIAIMCLGGIFKAIQELTSGQGYTPGSNPGSPAKQ